MREKKKEIRFYSDFPMADEIFIDKTRYVKKQVGIDKQGMYTLYLKQRKVKNEN